MGASPEDGTWVYITEGFLTGANCSDRRLMANIHLFRPICTSSPLEFTTKSLNIDTSFKIQIQEKISPTTIISSESILLI